MQRVYYIDHSVYTLSTVASTLYIPYFIRDIANHLLSAVRYDHLTYHLSTPSNFLPNGDSFAVS